MSSGPGVRGKLNLAKITIENNDIFQISKISKVHYAYFRLI